MLDRRNFLKVFGAVAGGTALGVGCVGTMTKIPPEEASTPSDKLRYMSRQPMSHVTIGLGAAGGGAMQLLTIYDQNHD